MAYQNYFPATYQPIYPQQIQQPVQYQQPTPAPASAPQNQNNGLIWIQGVEAAKSYLVGAGNSVVLFDSESPTFFIKSADQSGMPTLRTFRFEEVTESSPAQREDAPQIDTNAFITRDEFESRIAELTAPKKTQSAPVRKESKANG